MNKSELIAAMAEKSGLSKVDAQKALNAFTETIAEQLQAGEKIAIPSFGTFSVQERAARTGINPATKETIQIAAKKIAKFKAGSGLALN